MFIREMKVEYSVKEVEDEYAKCSSPEEVVKFYFNKKLAFSGIEKFYALYLNGKNELLCWSEISQGGINSVNPNLRENLKRALLVDAYSILVVHNHPSGDIQPSREDIEFTNALKKATELLELELLDHIIVGMDRQTGHINFFSFKREGLLKNK